VAFCASSWVLEQLLHRDKSVGYSVPASGSICMFCQVATQLVMAGHNWYVGDTSVSSVRNTTVSSINYSRLQGELVACVEAFCMGAMPREHTKMHLHKHGIGPSISTVHT
jgi:hypothetical protein